MAGPLTAELTAREVIAPGIAELAFTMRSPERLVFRAGQFVSVALPSPAEEAATAIPRRSYSIASQSDAGDRLRFIIRVIPEGKASDYLMTLPLGATINLTGPHGFFVLDPVHAGDIVFAATGTGVAAVMPMLGELAKQRRSRASQIVVFWGLRYEEDIFARGEIEALAAAAGAELAVHLTAPGPGWAGGRGRITAALLDRLPGFTAPTFYLVGNGAMITELKRELISRGVNRKTQIRTEAFFD
ncbi:MAG TPA: FAD-binding oxidoreductase [Polyangia bacterium]|nr:FAD-binding oxidoreductase [Polyangia bacterium]